MYDVAKVVKNIKTFSLIGNMFVNHIKTCANLCYVVGGHITSQT